MPDLPALPDSGWSSIEKAFYCRAQAINLLEEAERTDRPAQAEELAGVALRWLALARFHEAESTRSLMTDEQLREHSDDRTRPNGQPYNFGSRSRRHDIAED